jgi:hypothetical protein
MAHLTFSISLDDKRFHKDSVASFFKNTSFTKSSPAMFTKTPAEYSLSLSFPFFNNSIKSSTEPSIFKSSSFPLSKI